MTRHFLKFTILFSLFTFSCASSLVFADQIAPNFNLETSTGKFQLADFRGKVVYVDFWASWCAPCRKSFPWLNEMQKKYKDQGLIIIGINVDRERSLAETFLKDTPADFPMAYDPDGELASKYKLVGMPSAYLIDKQGNIMHTHIGFRANKIKSYEKAIQHLLGN